MFGNRVNRSENQSGNLCQDRDIQITPVKAESILKFGSGFGSGYQDKRVTCVRIGTGHQELSGFIIATN